MIDSGIGYKVFHFGVAPEYQDRWLTAHRGPGFHVWLSWESAHRYLDGLENGVVKRVLFRHAKPIDEPEGEAVVAQQLYVPEVAST